MLKKMLTLGLAIVVVVGASLGVLAAAYSYDIDEAVVITLEIPTILVLDMGASTNDITWATVTAADLDNGFVVRRCGTSFVVDSNDEQGWEVNAVVTSDAAGEHWDSTTGNNDAELAITTLHLLSGVIDLGTIQTYSTITCTDGDTWEAFTAKDSTVTVAEASGELSQGSDIVIGVDYKVQTLDWTINPDTYIVTVTYTLTGKP